MSSPKLNQKLHESSMETSKQNFVQSLDSLKSIEEFSKISIPSSLKNILEANDFNTCLHFLNINENVIENIEEFCRNVLPNLIDKDAFKQYFGIYHLKPQEFHLTQGHRMIITLISEKLKAKYKSFDQDISSSVKPRKVLPSAPSSESQTDAPKNYEENDESSITLIKQALVTWVKSKIGQNSLEDISRSLTSMQLKIHRSGQDKEGCEVKCFCGTFVRIQKLKKKDCKRWIYSNYHKHFNKFHTQNSNIATKPQNETPVNKKGNSKQLLLTKFAKSLNKFEQESTEKTKKINILQNTIISPAKSDTGEKHLNNEEKSIVEKNTLMKTDKETVFNNHIPEFHILNTEEANIGIQCEEDTAEKDFNPELCETEELKEKVQNFEEEWSEEAELIEKKFEENSLKRKLSDEHLDVYPDHSTMTLSIMETKQGGSAGCSTPMKKSHNEKQKITGEQSEKKSKWKTQYSRLERRKRLREKNNFTNQSKITDFYAVVQKLENFLEENTALKNQLGKNLNFDSMKNTKSKLLELILNIAEKNHKRNKFANRFDDVMKQFCLYLYYVGGKLLYETLQANIPDALPSISTLNHYIEENCGHYEEGYFDFSGLSLFLTQRNLPRLIWLAEDATRISGKIEYDSKTDRIVGFSPPLEDGIPNAGLYQASSEKRIREIFKNAKKANYINVCMAQPLSTDAPAYILSVFGTDNKFTFRDVSIRWKYIEESMKKYNISLVGISTDGDSRFLKSMKVSSLIGNVSRFTCPIPTDMKEDWSWYHMELDDTVPCFIQDEIHIGTKLRTRLIKPNIILPIGKYFISIDHLQKVLDEFPKNEHFLTRGDLKPIDKMNFEAANKICSSRVIHLLQTKIANSKGTVLFLKNMRAILDAFLSKNIDTKARIYKLWCGVFFFRIWKLWLKDQKQYCIKDNFISGSCYDAVELNAHNFIKLVRLFRIRNMDHSLFCPWIFSSQSCEKLFRAARSMSSTFSTVINFSLKDFLYRISRLRVLNNIIFDLQNEMIFPRELKKHQEKNSILQCSYLTDNEIKQIVEMALEDTISEMKDVGIIADRHKTINLKTNMSVGNENFQPSVQEDDIVEDDEELDDNEEDIMQIERENAIRESAIGENAIRDNSSNNLESLLLENEVTLQQSVAINEEESVPTSRMGKNIYIKLKTENGFDYIKKSTFIWLLDENDGKPSNDRLKRFILPRKHCDRSKNESKSGSNKTRIFHNRLINSSEDDDDDYDDICFKNSEDSEVSDEEQADYNTSNLIQYSELKIEIDKFYAVFYNDPRKEWFIGQVRKKIKDDVFQISFLREDGGKFVQSRIPDIAHVEKKFIFCGPLILKSDGKQQFILKRADLVKIRKIFQNM